MTVIIVGNTQSTSVMCGYASAVIIIMCHAGLYRQFVEGWKLFWQNFVRKEKLELVEIMGKIC